MRRPSGRLNYENMKIPDKTHIQSIDLRVKNLESSLHFYSYLLGFREIRRNKTEAWLSASGKEPYMIRLEEDKNAKFAPRGTTGLYHTAYRFPDRKSLAQVFMRLFDHKIKFHGFSDHLVSEAIYLPDPDENGVELYIDKPRDEWEWRMGEVVMASEPLDLTSITKAYDANEKWTGVNPGTDIGHIHLRTADIFKTDIFYSVFLGFNITTASYPGALFLSAGGYHHHIGANIWQSKAGSPPPPDSLGLIKYTINIPDKEYLTHLKQSAPASNITAEEDVSGNLLLKDFDSHQIVLTL